MKSTIRILLLLGIVQLSSGEITKAQPDSSGYYRSFDGRRIYFEIKGQGDPVVLVHGFIVNGESWKKLPLYADLLEAGYRLITMDLRGNGKSDKPHDSSSYANDAEALDVMGLLDALKVKNYLLVGYSRGSIIGARLLVKDKRISKAVLGGMGDGFTDPVWPRRIMFYHALMDEPVPELAEMVKYVKKSNLDQRALAMMQLEQPSTSPEELSGIRIPVLLVDGDKDPDNGSPYKLAEMIPGSTLRIVPGDHGAALRSQEFSNEVLHFFGPPGGQ